MNTGEHPAIASLFNSDRYTVRERELLCAPTYKPGKNASAEQIKAAETAKNVRKSISRELAKTFENGTNDASRDAWKAHNYKQIAEEQSLPAPGSNLFRTKHVYEKHVLFSQIRLLLVRIGRITSYFGHVILPTFFAAFGLSYGITFAFDVGIVIKNTFDDQVTRDAIKNEKSLLKRALLLSDQLMQAAYWQRAWIRCKNAIMKDNRLYRLLNDGVWFAVNLTVFLTTGPLFLIINPVLNLIGFSFDVVHEAFWFGKHTHRHHHLMNKLSDEIKEKEHQLEKNELTADQRSTLANDIAALNLMRDEIRLKRNSEFKRRLWTVAFTALLLVGMVMLYFPPTAIPGAFLIGCGLALAAGSIFTGIGRRMYMNAMEYGKKAWDWLQSKRQPNESPQSRMSISLYNPDNTTLSSDTAVTRTLRSQSSSAGNITTASSLFVEPTPTSKDPAGTPPRSTTSTSGNNAPIPLFRKNTRPSSNPSTRCQPPSTKIQQHPTQHSVSCSVSF